MASERGRHGHWKIVKVRHLRCGRVMIQLARLPLREGCVMNSPRGWRDPRTGRVFGFQSETQRENFMIGRARFCNGPNREMPRCTALNRLGEPCKAARMRGQVDLLPPQRWFCQTSPPDRCAPFRRPGPHPARRDAIRTQPAARSLAARSARARQNDHADLADEATCRAWAARQGFQLDVLDRDLPAFSDACRWIWARMSRGLISDDDLTAKLARLRNRITEASRAFDHSR